MNKDKDHLSWEDIGLRTTWSYRTNRRWDKIKRRGRILLSRMGLMKKRTIMDNFPHWVIAEDHTLNMTHLVGNFVTQISETPDGYRRTGSTTFFD